MTPTQRKWAGIAVVVAVLGGATVTVVGVQRRGSRAPEASSAERDQPRVGKPVPAFAAQGRAPQAGLPEFNPVGSTAQDFTPESVATTMAQWRSAILLKNAEGVERIDDVFRAAPQVFSAALQASAQRDPDARVRAFSTRVLGNTRRKDAMAALRTCLTDANEHVRANAAWALLQVHDQSSLTLLGQLAARDPSPIVRAAATDAVQRLSNLAASDHSP